MLVLTERLTRSIHIVDGHGDGVVEEGGVHWSVHEAADGNSRGDLTVCELQRLLQRFLVDTKHWFHYPYAQRGDVKLPFHSSYTLRAIRCGHGCIDVKR